MWEKVSTCTHVTDCEPCPSVKGLSVQQQQAGDEDAFAYNNTLRRSIFDAYSGIFNGMSRDKINMYMPQYVPVSIQASEVGERGIILKSPVSIGKKLLSDL